MGQQGPQVAKKKKDYVFQKWSRPDGMPKQVFLGRFELVVARSSPPKIPKCLENGLFWDHYLGCANKWNEPNLSPC